MRAKQYLNRLEILNIKLDQKKAELQVAMDEMGMSTRSYGEPVQTSFCGATGNQTEEQAIRIASLQIEIQKQIIEYHEEKDRIINQIHALQNVLFIDVLYRRYVEDETDFVKIAYDMGYSYKYILNAHGRALQEFEKRHKDILEA